MPVQHFGKCFLLVLTLQQRDCWTEDRSMAPTQRSEASLPRLTAGHKHQILFFAHNFYEYSFTSLF